MQLLIARIFDGIANGTAYGLVALALVVIYKSTTLINFAQGEMGLLGAYLTYMLTASFGLNVWVAVVLAMLLSAGIGAGIERTLIRPFDPANHLALALVTLGLFLGINAAVAIIWGHEVRRLPNLFPDGALVNWGPARLTWATIGTVVVALVAVVLLMAFLRYTKVGLAFRSVSSNMESSRLAGLNVSRTLQIGWALAAAIGTLGAVMFVSTRSLDPSSMSRVLIYAAAAAALGGLDSIGGALIGGLVLGLVQSVVVQYVPAIPTEMSVAVAVLVLAIVLLVKPNGLFGTRKVVRA